MKKKVLYGVALALLAGMSVVSLPSCKDDLNDLKTQTSFDLNSLDQTVQLKLNALKELIDALQRDKQDKGDYVLSTKLNEYLKKGQLDGLLTQGGYLKKDELDGLLTQDGYLKDDAADPYMRQNALIQYLRDNNYVTSNNLDGYINGITIGEYLRDYAKLKYVHQLIYGEESDNQQAFADILENGGLYAMITGALSGCNCNVDDVKKIINLLWPDGEDKDDALKKLDGKIGANQTAIQTINDFIDLNMDPTKPGYKTLKTKLQEIDQELATLKNDEGKYRLDLLEAAVQTLENKLNALTSRLDNFISSLIAQGTDSPIFGNFSLPLGIKSNLLFNWYGYSDNMDFDFPSYDPNVNYYDLGENGVLPISETELKALAPKTETIKRGFYGDVNLGKLYMTINPAGHFFNDNAFSLQTSAEKTYPASLVVNKSDYEMYFGYTRGVVEGNGFYEADVIVKENEIEKAKIEIEDGLRSAAKDVLNKPSKSTAVDLLKAVYNQLNGMLPAYAVRYDWTVNDADGKPQDYSVLSGYDIAAATTKPLSYSFLYGKGTTKKLRTFGPLQNFIYNLKDNENLKFKLEGKVDFDNVSLSIPDITVGKIDGNKLVITIPAINIYGTGTESGKIIGTSDPITIPGDGATIEGFDALAEEMANKITEGLNNALKNVNSQINTQVLNQVKREIDKMIDNMNSQVNGKIQSAIKDFGDKAEPYFKRINKVIDLYNKVAGKINSFLADPNHYLQVAMFYDQANSQIGLLSNTLKDPTKFESGNGWIGLYASSYTGEIVVPAYKKYVAITNIYDADTKKSLNPSSDELIALNAKGKYLNQVMDGCTIRFGIDASALSSDKIYEIVYQGVDYSGRTSTQKFYIKVKSFN